VAGSGGFREGPFEHLGEQPWHEHYAALPCAGLVVI
jgi:hypothetical protein